MGKLSEIFKGSYEKWKSLSRGKKIAFGVSLVGVLTIIIYLSVTLGTTKYGILFKDLEPNEAKLVMDKLKEKKITDYKVSGSTISVPESMVEELRLELAPDISSGDKGWELFDSGNTFSTTDTELKIKYQRALQAELERTIKGFPQIDKARVALVLPEESVFVKDATPASASVTLIMKSGQNLTEDQVRSIVSLVSGSVKNLPKENVQVVDDKLRLLSKDIFNEDNVALTNATDKQQQLKKEYEKNLESKVMEQLSKPFKNKVTVKVNADLDFDAVQSVTNTVDPKGAVVSEQYERNTNGNTTTRPSQSPVDNNMTNNTPTQNTTTNNANDVTYQKETKNYENSKSETKTVKAPGSVKRVTASIIIDGNLEDAQKEQIKSLVAGAIGFDDKRGDSINVEGIAFDSSDVDAAKKAVEELKASEDKAARTKLYTELAIGGVAAIGLITLIIALARKGKKRSPQEEQLEAIVSPKGLDVLLGDDEPSVAFKPIDFDKQGNNERSHLENEIKRYASEKPDQVADIIKSWLAEEER